MHIEPFDILLRDDFLSNQNCARMFYRGWLALNIATLTDSVYYAMERNGSRHLKLADIDMGRIWRGRSWKGLR
jgi:hypothetical protein